MKNETKVENKFEEIFDLSQAIQDKILELGKILTDKQLMKEKSTTSDGTLS